MRIVWVRVPLGTQYDEYLVMFGSLFLFGLVLAGIVTKLTPAANNRPIEEYFWAYLIVVYLLVFWGMSVVFHGMA